MLWTLKEAYLKAIGTGIGKIPLSSIEFSVIKTFSSYTLSSLTIHGIEMENWCFLTSCQDQLVFSIALGPFGEADPAISFGDNPATVDLPLAFPKASIDEHGVELISDTLSLSFVLDRQSSAQFAQQVRGDSRR